MVGYVVTVIVGIICIILGIGNAKGNISTLHSYHRNRVSKEDILPFGRLVGSGTILCGIGISVFGIVGALGTYFTLPILVIIGAAVMCVCLVLGLGISFYAMIKYNKGIF